jgi:hypothetical protein
MTRRSFRATVVLAGLFLLAGYWLAPRVPPGSILYLSIAWLAAAGYLLSAIFRVLRTWIGRAGAGILVVALVLVPIALTAIPVSPSTAVHLPCPRNWGWLPTWQLRPSPMGSVWFTVGSAKVKVCYGRPASRGRQMLGGSHVPFGRLWRTGANEPTTIIATGALEIAGIPVPVGRTSLYTVPGPETWEVILNRSTSQWGIESEYTNAVRARELGRAILRSETVTPRLERLTFFVEPETNGNSDAMELVLRWEGTQVRIPIAPASR